MFPLLHHPTSKQLPRFPDRWCNRDTYCQYLLYLHQFHTSHILHCAWLVLEPQMIRSSTSTPWHQWALKLEQLSQGAHYRMLPLAKGLIHRMTCRSWQLVHSTNPACQAMWLLRQPLIARHYPSNPYSDLNVLYPLQKLEQMHNHEVKSDQLSCYRAMFLVVQPDQFEPKLHRNKDRILRLQVLWLLLGHPEAKVRGWPYHSEPRPLRRVVNQIQRSDDLSSNRSRFLLECMDQTPWRRNMVGPWCMATHFVPIPELSRIFRVLA